MIRVLLLALALQAAAIAADDPLARRFDDANARSAAAKTPDESLAAAALYRGMLDEGVESGAIWFDYGNALMNAGATGRAIAAYRAAVRYLPRDPQVQANLQLALTKAGARPLSPSLVDRLVFWQDWLSWPEKQRLLELAAVAAFLCGVLALSWRRPFALFAKVLLVLLVPLAASFLLALKQVAFERRGAVAKPEVVARKGSADSFAPAFTQPLREGDEFVVQDREGDWLSIRLGDGLDAWVKASDVETY